MVGSGCSPECKLFSLAWLHWANVQRPRTRYHSQEDPFCCFGPQFPPCIIRDGFLFGPLTTFLCFMNFSEITGSIGNVTYAPLLNSHAHRTKFGRSQKVEKNHLYFRHPKKVNTDIFFWVRGYPSSKQFFKLAPFLQRAWYKETYFLLLHMYVYMCAHAQKWIGFFYIYMYLEGRLSFWLWCGQ